MADPDPTAKSSKTTHQDHEARLKLYADRRRQKKKQQPPERERQGGVEGRGCESESERSLQQQVVEVDADVFASFGAKILAVDMPAFMQIHAVDCARKTHDSLEKFRAKALALTLKKGSSLLPSLSPANYY